MKNKNLKIRVSQEAYEKLLHFKAKEAGKGKILSFSEIIEEKL
jgi:predicted CopG family antitoxin